MRRNNKVICAAVKRGEVVIAGVRHWDMVMHKTVEAIGEENFQGVEVQGFLDRYGTFLDRNEALDLAHEAGQVNKADCMGQLYSEDLY